MVSVLPGGNRWSLLGSMMGQGIDQGVSSYQQNVKQPMALQKQQQEFQQNLYNQAFDELGKIDKEKFASMSPIEQLTSVAKPFASIPQGMDFLKVAYPELLKTIMSQQKPESQRSAIEFLLGGKKGPQGQQAKPPFALGQEPQQGQPNTQANQATIQPKLKGKKGTENVKNTEAFNKKLVDQMRPDLQKQINKFTQQPTFNTPEKYGLNLEDEQKLRQRLVNQGYRPETIESAVQSVRDEIGRQWDEAKTKHNINEDFYKRKNEKWAGPNGVVQTVEKNLPDLLKGYTGNTADNFKGKLYEYAAEQDPNLTPQQIYNNARARLREDEKEIQKLVNIPGLTPIRVGLQEATNRMKAIQNGYKGPLKNGYEGAIYEDAINNKGLGPEEAHIAIWGPQTSKQSIKSLSELPRYPTAFENAGYGSIPNIKKNKSLTPEYRENYLVDLAKRLSKIKPDDDLMVLRGTVLDKNIPEELFPEALQRAQDEYGLELSPFQQKMLGEVNQPRIRPLDELFSQPFKYVEWLTNFITGQR